ncbi:MAG: serine/threonine-protein kinase [Pseudomonadota bacterium]
MSQHSPVLTILPREQRKFGRYTLLYRFASGGMANVYLGKFKGPDGFEKLVAIKRIHEHNTENPDFVRMFTDEARLAARISHTNVVQTMELGVEEGWHFIAMEYVDGESLAAFVRKCRLPFSIAARIIADSAGGLHAAHELRDSDGSLLNVVHRDVSPQNILVSYEGGVKVADFGVARAKSNLHVTLVGTLKGKFSYMSPEQVKSQEIDCRADVFALGIVLYEITSRRRLFKGDTDIDTVNKVIRSDVTPPSKLVQDYPASLEKIVLKSLQPQPVDRFQTALEFQEALEHFVVETGAPVMQKDISKLMIDTFKDRIDQKRKLLRECAHSFDTVPEVNLPWSSPSLVIDESATIRAAKKGNKNGLGILIAGAIGIVLLTVFAFRFFSSNDDSGSVSSADVLNIRSVAKPLDSGVRQNEAIDFALEPDTKRDVAPMLDASVKSKNLPKEPSPKQAKKLQVNKIEPKIRQVDPTKQNKIAPKPVLKQLKKEDDGLFGNPYR